MSNTLPGNSDKRLERHKLLQGFDDGQQARLNVDVVFREREPENLSSEAKPEVCIGRLRLHIQWLIYQLWQALKGSKTLDHLRPLVVLLSSRGIVTMLTW